MEQNVTIMTVLEELKDFRAENNKKIYALDKRVSKLEEARKNDRMEIINILDTMQKSIDSQLIEIKDYMIIQFDKINAINIVNQAEHKQFREAIKNLDKRVDFQNSRITTLEQWKEDFEDGIIGVKYT